MATRTWPRGHALAIICENNNGLRREAQQGNPGGCCAPCLFQFVCFFNRAVGAVGEPAGLEV